MARLFWYIAVALLGTSVAAGAAVALDAPGQAFHITPRDMPAPYASDSVANGADTVPRDGIVPDAPEGFSVTLFADGITGARAIKASPNGDILVARSRVGAVSLLRDTDGDGRADTARDIATGLARPHGMTVHDGALWVADLNNIYRIAEPGAKPVPMGEAGLFGPKSGHWTRTIVFSPDGSALYAGIGSRGNIGEEDPIRATVRRFDVAPDGRISGGETFASGLRNPVGIAFMPGTDRLFTVVNERDGMGDGLVPDFMTEVRDGGFYGWPYAYIGDHPQPGFWEKRPDLVAASIEPDVLFQSHSAPIGLTFLANADVPEAWRDDALVTFRGSWNSAEPTGYKVVRVEFENGAPTGRYVNFLTGFRLDDPAENISGPAVVWGRPVGVAVGPDGAIYVGDEPGGTIWRVTR